MIKGVLGGLLSGGVVSVAVLGAVSLMSAPPAPRSVATSAQDEPAVPALPAPDAQPAVPARDDTAPTADAPGQTTASSVPADTASDTPAPEDATPDPAKVATAEPAAPTSAVSAPDVSATQPAPAAPTTETAPEAAVINPPAGSEFDKPAVDAPVAAPAVDPRVQTPDTPTATTPGPTEPAPASAAADTAPVPSQSQGARVLADAPSAEPAPATPSALQPPAAVESAPVPDVSAALEDPAPVLPSMTPEALPGSDGQSPSPESQPAAPQPSEPRPAESQPDESLPEESLPDETLPDETLPDETLPGDTLPGDVPGDVPGDLAIAPEPAPMGKRVLPPVRKQVDKAESQNPDASGSANVAPSDAPPAISSEAPDAPKGVTGAPKPGFARSVPGVRVNRLPTIQTAPQAAGTAAEDIPADDLPPETDAPAMPEAPAAKIRTEEPDTPLYRHAALFDNPQNLPVLAVVVIDIGKLRGGADLSRILALPAPITVAINPMRKDALEVAARCRAQGFEVAMLADGLPADGTASDVEVAYQSISAAMPEAVAVMTSPESTLLSRRPIAQQMVAILKDEGLGLVSYARGLSPARELARGEGLPQAEVNRVVDEPRGDAATVLRALESEAFQAQQKGGAVVVLRSYPDSLAALTQFMAKAEGQGVAVKVGPATAFLK